MDNIVIVSFKEYSKTFEVLSELKNQANSFNVPSAGVIVKENNEIVIKDFFNTGKYDSWAFGGLFGSIVGIIGGPLGMLLGGSLGTLLGSTFDAEEASNDIDIFNELITNISNEESVLMLLIREDDPFLLDNYLIAKGSTKIQRESLESVQNKILISQDIEEELRKKAKEEAKVQRKKERKEKLDENIKKIKATFSSK